MMLALARWRPSRVGVDVDGGIHVGAMAMAFVLAVRGVGIRICAAVVGGDGGMRRVAMVIGGVWQ